MAIKWVLPLERQILSLDLLLVLSQGPTGTIVGQDRLPVAGMTGRDRLADTKEMDQMTTTDMAAVATIHLLHQEAAVASRTEVVSSRTEVVGSRTEVVGSQTEVVVGSKIEVAVGSRIVADSVEGAEAEVAAGASPVVGTTIKDAARGTTTTTVLSHPSVISMM